MGTEGERNGRILVFKREQLLWEEESECRIGNIPLYRFSGDVGSRLATIV
jgi:hypothetical protein